MNPAFRQVIILIICSISLIITCNKCRKRNEATHGWNVNTEKQMRDVFYMQSANYTSNERSKEEYADCCLSKMKEIFPWGLPSSGDEVTDSIKIKIMKIGVECGEGFNNEINIWKPEVEQQLKIKFYSFEETKLLPDSIKAEYVNCIAFKVTTEFPNGLGDKNKKVLANYIEKSRNECLKLVLNKYKKNKRKKI